jgi:predicted phosphodiesterase
MLIPHKDDKIQIGKKPSVTEFVKKFKKAYEADKFRFDTLHGTTTNWSAPKLVRLYELLHSDPEVTQEEIADEFNVDRSGISRKGNGMDWNKFVAEVEHLCLMTQEEYESKAADIYREQATEKALHSERRRDIKHDAWLKTFREDLLEAVAPLPKKWYPPVSLGNKKNGAVEHAVLLLSDLHVGQRFTLNETGGLGEYNSDIFCRRLESLMRGSIEIFENHSKNATIPELHILCMGDLVQGGNLNGEWGPAYQEGISARAQVKIAAAALADMLGEFSRFFPKVTLIGIVGNHGRAGVSKNSDKVDNNFDNFCYDIVEARLSNIKNVEIITTDTWWANREINGKNFLAVHGDYISGNLDSLAKEGDRIRSLTRVDYDFLCMGHFHKFTTLQVNRSYIFVNGSFPGGDIHSMQHMRIGSVPSQVLMGISERGIAWTYNMELDRERENLKPSISTREMAKKFGCPVSV